MLQEHIFLSSSIKNKLTVHCLLPKNFGIFISQLLRAKVIFIDIMGKNTRMQQWINYRIRVTVDDSRMFVGRLMAFDRHMNLVLADTEEIRRVKSSDQQEPKEIKRVIGFLLIRGESIISIRAEAPPAPEPRRTDIGPHGGGRGVLPRPLARPMAPMVGAAPLGLEGPVRGIAGVPQF